MSEEIKIIHAPVEKALADLKSSIQSLETSFSKDIKGENNLQMVDKINEIKQTYETILTSYQSLLINNIEATTRATEQLKEAEARVASSIQLIK